MTNDLMTFEPEFDNTDIQSEKSNAGTVLFTVTEKTIETTLKPFMALKIAGIDDLEGREKVKEALKVVVKARTTTGKEKDAAKAFYIAEGKRIQADYNGRVKLIEPIETHLNNEELRIEKEEAEALKKKLDVRQEERQKLLDAVGGVPAVIGLSVGHDHIRVCEEPQFMDFLSRCRRTNELIAEQKAAQKKIDDENARLAEVKAAQDKKDAEQAEKQRLLDQQESDLSVREQSASNVPFAGFEQPIESVSAPLKTDVPFDDVPRSFGIPGSNTGGYIPPRGTAGDYPVAPNRNSSVIASRAISSQFTVVSVNRVVRQSMGDCAVVLEVAGGSYIELYLRADESQKLRHLLGKAEEIPVETSKRDSEEVIA